MTHESHCAMVLHLVFMSVLIAADPGGQINNTTSIFFDGNHLYKDNMILDDYILNNQYDISNNFVVYRDINKVNEEIYNFINNKVSKDIYGVSILEVLKYIIRLSNYINEIKFTIRNFKYPTENFVDMILNIIKNNIYVDKKTILQKLLDVNNINLQDKNITNNMITYDTSYNKIDILYNYPISIYQNLNLIDIPYEINYSIDINYGLYPYKIIVDDTLFNSYTVYKIDFLNGENTLNNNIIIDDPIVYENQLIFYNKKDFDINHDFVISAYKSYNVSLSKLSGYIYTIDISLNLDLFSIIKYKTQELSIYDKYIISPVKLDNITSYIQGEISTSVYESDISNNKTFIKLIKLNENIDISSNEYNIYFLNDNKYYKIENIIGTMIIINDIIERFTISKIIIIFNSKLKYINQELYHIELTEKLNINEYISKNYFINDIIPII